VVEQGVRTVHGLQLIAAHICEVARFLKAGGPTNREWLPRP
jgi:hypothetical protein